MARSNAVVKDEKKAPEPKTDKNLPVQLAPGGAPPAYLANAMGDGGRGVSTKAEDNLVPMIYILQTNSPQVNKRGADYIEDAEAGDIWLRNSVQPIHSGEEGIVVQPCYFSKDWVEWKPSRGGFAGRHDRRPDDAEETEVKGDDGNLRKAWVRRNGNLVVETRYHFVLVNDAPYVIPMSSTGHTTSRAWMALMGQFKLNGNIVDSFARKYRMTTVAKSNASGDWFGWRVEDMGWVSAGEYEEGRKLYESVASGEKRAEAEVGEGAGAEGRDDSGI